MRLIGEKDLGTVASMDMVGNVLRDQGKYAEAEGMHRRALARRERADETLTTMSDSLKFLNRTFPHTFLDRWQHKSCHNSGRRTQLSGAKNSSSGSL